MCRCTCKQTPHACNATRTCPYLVQEVNALCHVLLACRHHDLAEGVAVQCPHNAILLRKSLECVRHARHVVRRAKIMRDKTQSLGKRRRLFMHARTHERRFKSDCAMLQNKVFVSQVFHLNQLQRWRNHNILVAPSHGSCSRNHTNETDAHNAVKSLPYCLLSTSTHTRKARMQVNGHI
jgi:hypothetical protein